MDSLTQAVLGAGVAGAIAPRGQRHRALLLGAALGTLPDLDVFIDFGDPVSNMTRHRGFSHSLFVLPAVAVAVWLALCHWWAPARQAKLRWFLAVSLALITHPLLDAHTAYGTQLLWPMTLPPVSWSTVFIIDPAYTLPLLVAVIWVSVRPGGGRFSAPLLIALALSTAYLGWSWHAKMRAESHAREVLAGGELEGAPMFSTPTPFNTLLWRVVVLTGDGYLEGLYSLISDDGPMRFDRYASDNRALAESSHIPAVRRLRWFARDFLRATVEDGELVLTDLRMGSAQNYAFAHAVARQGNPSWIGIDPVQVRSPRDAIDFSGIWTRMFSAPPDLGALQTDWPEYGLVRGPDGYYLSRQDSRWGSPGRASILRIDFAGYAESIPGWALVDRDESDFYYSADRRRGCFVTDRASGQFAPNSDIWCVDWLGDHWGEPTPLPPPVNSESAEFSPVIRPNGDLYFASDRDGGAGQGDIYHARPTNDGWAVERLGRPVNSTAGEWNLDISPEGDWLIFEASQRATNRTAAGDLYLARWDGAAWTDAVPIAVMNTDGSDLMPRFIGDDTIVYATSIGGDVELRKITRREIEQSLPEPGRPASGPARAE